MDGAQSLVGVGAAGLLLANEWHSADRGLFGGVLWSKGTDPTEAHKALVRVGGELVFILVAIMLAGVSSTWAAVVGVMVAALWVLWLINRHGATAPAKTGGG